MRTRKSVVASWIGYLVFPSPSKIFLLRRARREFRRFRPQTVLDVASAEFKYRVLFPRAAYTGVDYDSEALSRGLAACSVMGPKFRSEGIRANLAQPLTLDSTYDMVVSLHTLDHLSPKLLGRTVRDLSDSVAKGGVLVLHGRGLDDPVQQISNDYETLTVEDCDSQISHRFERFWGNRVGSRNPFFVSLQILSFFGAFLCSFIEPKVAGGSSSKLIILGKKVG